VDIIGPFSARPSLPRGLEVLAELALDLRWIWSHQADHIWRRVDPQTWETTRNPWLILQEASRERLASLADDPTFLHDLQLLLQARERYAAARAPLDDPLQRPVAYFSMEYGLGDAIPLYAGGLGVLAGDHLEAASDMGVPIVAVGLLYQEGYFRQAIDEEGRQEELYPYNDPTVLPIQPTGAPSGGWLKIPVELPGRMLWLRAWTARIGRVTLFLLDANVPINEPRDRGITAKLYGDGPEMRLRQEIALGIGGWRLLDALGIQPGACHLNEGHAAFVVLERARAAMRGLRLSFSAALAATRAGNVFTTHTPVAAGFDAFSVALMRRYFPSEDGLLAELGLSFDQLMALGRAPGAGPSEPFRPTYLAVRGAARVNGVSALHGRTTRELFAPLYPRWPIAEIPVSHVTNGVHVPSWDSSFSDELWTSACGPDRWRGSLEGHETAVAAVDDAKLWAVRAGARRQLVDQMRVRLAAQIARRGGTAEDSARAARVLDPDLLTVAFARRFAEYKRPNLLLRDPARLRRLLLDAHRPIQLLIAGKAHPADQEGKDLVADWVRFAMDPNVRARCVFLEDYDLALAQELVQGVDVWINMPRRPWEACGTSGMKVLVNGGLNLSALDGWWVEAYEPDVGWAIGAPDRPSDDERDAESLFRVIEEEIVPTFYDRDADGLPRAWLRRVRASLARLTPRFSANRMLREYVVGLYRPAERDVAARLSEGAAGARALESWARDLTVRWPGMRFGELTVQSVDSGWVISVEVFLNEVALEDVDVELYAEANGQPDRLRMQVVGPLPGTNHGFSFKAQVPAGRPPGDWTPRIIPASRAALRLLIPAELSLITWHH
jgi:glycogen phosphorylase